MNLLELNEKLKELGVPDNTYCLNTHLQQERYCISNENGKWETYFSERGKKNDLRVFLDESDACSHFLFVILRDLRSIGVLNK